MTSGGARHLHLVLVLCGWLLATGVHWDLVQVVAWARMLTENAQALPWSAAVGRTFSTEGMCGVCRTVQAAKQEQRETPGPAATMTEKVPLILPQAIGLVLTTTASADLTESVVRIPATVRAAPPVPPPRAG